MNGIVIFNVNILVLIAKLLTAHKHKLLLYRYILTIFEINNRIFTFLTVYIVNQSDM